VAIINWSNRAGLALRFKIASTVSDDGPVSFKPEPDMEKRQHHNKTPGMEGELSVAFDVSTGEMRAVGSGFWSVEQTNAFFVDWKNIVGRIQQGGHPVSALVDLTRSDVQQVEVANIIATVGDGLYLPGDAIALLMPSSLTKMQMRRVLDRRFHELFLSQAAAETWLQSRSAAAVGQPRTMRQNAESTNFFGKSLLEARNTRK
jgi:hypothetical protein